MTLPIADAGTFPREALTAAQNHASFLEPAWLQSSAFEDL